MKARYCVMYAPFSKEIRAGREVRCNREGYGQISDSYTDVTAQAVWAVIQLMRAGMSEGHDSIVIDGWMLTLSEVPDREVGSP